MRTKALLLFAATVSLAGCPQETAPASLPPAGLAGGAAHPGATTGLPQGHPTVAEGTAQGAASQPASPHAAAPRAAPHPPMNTIPGASAGEATAPSSQPATPRVIPGGGAAAVEEAADLSGTVTEAHHVKEYTYLHVKDVNGNGHWAAVLKDETLAVGTKVTLGKDIWMSDFQSPSMGRTFDRILFGRVITKQ